MKKYMLIVGLFVAGYLKASNDEKPVRSAHERQVQMIRDRITPTDEEMAKWAGYDSVVAYWDARSTRPASADFINHQG